MPPSPKATLPHLPGVWRCDSWSPSPLPACATGHAALDAELPGGGWPVGELIELLQPPAAQHEIRLLLPALRQAQRQGPLVLVGAPHLPHLAALAAQGLPAARWLRVEAEAATERLWAAEQVLRSGAAGAVLVWLPQARAEHLRRLHLAAREATPAGDGAGPLLFALRPESARPLSSPAPLRLLLQGDGPGLRLQVFKRRGPPQHTAITLPAELPVMACLRRLPAAPLSVPAHVVDRPVAPLRRPARTATA